MKHSLLFIHGIHDDRSAFDRMIDFLQEGQTQYEIHAISLIPNGGEIPIEVMAEQLADYIERHIPQPVTFDIVAFSMGTIVSRYYLQYLEGYKRVKRFISISGPHRGTWTAYFSNLPAIRQMRPGSSFLQKMEQGIDILSEISWISLRTPFDLMIFPSSSSKIPGAVNIDLPVLIHPWMLKSKRVFEIVKKYLADEHDPT